MFEGITIAIGSILMIKNNAVRLADH